MVCGYTGAEVMKVAIEAGSLPAKLMLTYAVSLLRYKSLERDTGHCRISMRCWGRKPSLPPAEPLGKLRIDSSTCVTVTTMEGDPISDS